MVEESNGSNGDGPGDQDGQEDRLDHWEAPETIERFSSRDPDPRLIQLLDETPEPEHLHALDLGCAGGRNAELLAQRGCWLTAVDTSQGMVAKTRERLVPILGEVQAREAVRVAPMTDLGFLPDASVDLIVAFGIYHQAETDEEYQRALRESARVLRPGGLCMVSNFAPGTSRPGRPMRKVEGTRSIYKGLGHGRNCMRTLEELDQDFREMGLMPVEPTRMQERHDETMNRFNVRGLYRKK